MKNEKIITLFILTSLLTSFLLLAINFPQGKALTWSGETQLTTDPDYDILSSVTQANDGKIWVVWTSDRSGNFDIYYKTYNGASWSGDASLVSSTQDDMLPWIFQAANGKIWVVWSSSDSSEGGLEIFFKTSSNNGVSWSANTQLTNSTFNVMNTSPSITQTPDGKIWVFFQSDRNGNADVYYKIYDEQTWSGDIRLTTSSSEDTNPAVITARDGTIWVFWTSYRDSNYEVYYKTTSDYGAHWSVDTRLTHNTAEDSRPYPMQTKDGKIWIVWYSSRTGIDELFYNTYNGTAWGTDTQLTFDTSPNCDPAVFQDKNFKIWIFFDSYRPPGNNDDLYYMTASINHDVGITSVVPSATVIYQGYGAQVQVTAKNYAVNAETFNITVFYDSTNIVGTQEITLAPGATTTLTFAWNTTSVPYGNHTISASISGVLFDEDTADNYLSNGTVFATIPGDVNCDRAVDILDAASLSAHWYPGPPIGPLGYDPNADINGDGAVDLLDAAIVSDNWYTSW